MNFNWITNFDWKWGYLPWIIGIVIALLVLIYALRRIIKGIISYRRLGKKEFMNRLKDGFDNITATQKTKAELRGIVISLIGMILGIVVMSIFRIKNIWFWAIISLVGGVIITIVQLIGKIQQYRIYKKQDDIMKDLSEEQEENVNK
jgi:predicted PurR-regulated permease PerM